jgi:hypothetical protein
MAQFIVCDLEDDVKARLNAALRVTDAAWKRKSGTFCATR